MPKNFQRNYAGGQQKLGYGAAQVFKPFKADTTEISKANQMAQADSIADRKAKLQAAKQAHKKKMDISKRIEMEAAEGILPSQKDRQQKGRAELYSWVKDHYDDDDFLNNLELKKAEIYTNEKKMKMVADAVNDAKKEGMDLQSAGKNVKGFDELMQAYESGELSDDQLIELASGMHRFIDYSEEINDKSAYGHVDIIPKEYSKEELDKEGDYFVTESGKYVTPGMMNTAWRDYSKKQSEGLIQLEKDTETELANQYGADKWYNMPLGQKQQLIDKAASEKWKASVENSLGLSHKKALQEPHKSGSGKGKAVVSGVDYNTSNVSSDVMYDPSSGEDLFTVGDLEGSRSEDGSNVTLSKKDNQGEVVDEKQYQIHKRPKEGGGYTEWINLNEGTEGEDDFVELEKYRKRSKDNILSKRSIKFKSPVRTQAKVNQIIYPGDVSKTKKVPGSYKITVDAVEHMPFFKDSKGRIIMATDSLIAKNKKRDNPRKMFWGDFASGILQEDEGKGKGDQKKVLVPYEEGNVELGIDFDKYPLKQDQPSQEKEESPGEDIKVKTINYQGQKVYTPVNESEYESLPSGSVYKDSNGKFKKKK